MRRILAQTTATGLCGCVREVPVGEGSLTNSLAQPGGVFKLLAQGHLYYLLCSPGQKLSGRWERRQPTALIQSGSLAGGMWEWLSSITWKTRFLNDQNLRWIMSGVLTAQIPPATSLQWQQAALAQSWARRRWHRGRAPRNWGTPKNASPSGGRQRRLGRGRRRCAGPAWSTDMPVVDGGVGS